MLFRNKYILDELNKLEIYFYVQKNYFNKYYSMI